MNPFAVLNLPFECSDADVRAAYQKLLRQHTPENSPETFQLISAAAKMLQTEESRCQWVVSSKGDGRSPAEVLAEFTSFPGRKKTPGARAFRAMLRASASAARTP